MSYIGGGSRFSRKGGSNKNGGIIPLSTLWYSVLLIFLHFLKTLHMTSYFQVMELNSHLQKKIEINCFNEHPLKMKQKAFYFISKALFICKIFKFLFWLYGHVEKKTLLER